MSTLVDKIWDSNKVQAVGLATSPEVMCVGKNALQELEQAMSTTLHKAYKAILSDDDWKEDNGCGIFSCAHCGAYFNHDDEFYQTIEHKPDCVVPEAQKALAN